VLPQSPKDPLGPFVRHLQLFGVGDVGFDRPPKVGFARQFGDSRGNQARCEFDGGFPQRGSDVLDRAAPAMPFETEGELSQTGLGRRSLVDERASKIEKEPADLSSREA
jgi:hypothetical protein